MAPARSQRRAAGAGGGTDRGRNSGSNGSDRRGQLLDMAIRLFATKGYTQTTVRDIADEAGILSGSLYHHFSSKEAMLDEILRSFLEELLGRFSMIEAEGDNPREVLDELVRATFATIEAKPYTVALYQNELSTLGAQPGFEYVAAISHRLEEIWVRVIRSGQQDGTFRTGIDPALAYRFIRDATWATVQWYRPGGRHTHSSLAEQYLDMLHGGLLGRTPD